MGQHQVEFQSLRSIHQEELNRIEQAHINKTVQQLNALREKLDNEREDACAKEREIMRVKYVKQLDEMDAIHTSKFQRLQVQLDLLIVNLICFIHPILSTDRDRTGEGSMVRRRIKNKNTRRRKNSSSRREAETRKDGRPTAFASRNRNTQTAKCRASSSIENQMGRRERRGNQSAKAPSRDEF